MEDTLKNKILDSIINKNVTQTSASKMFNISQPKISLLLKNEGYTSIVENGKTTYFKVDKKETSLLSEIDSKLFILQQDVSRLLVKQTPLKQIKKESFKLTLKKTYNKSIFEATSENLNTKTKRRTFRIPSYILDELDNYLLEDPEKFSVFISSVILFGIENCRLPIIEDNK